MMRTLTSCRMCEAADLEMFLDLGEQPLANRFLSEADLASPEPRYPLQLAWCARCNLVQLLHVVDKEELYREYIYFSSGMPRLSDHFHRYAQQVMDRCLEPDDLVVEIASNDGVLLRWFGERGYRTLGIEPARNIAASARDRGVPTLGEFFSEDLARQVAGEHGQARAILSNNVVAHIDDHHDLARGVARLLHPQGAWVIEAPHLLDMFENLAYDTAYHEHLSYLALRPMQRWLGEHGLEVFDIAIHPVQGQSLRAFVGHAGAHPIAASVSEITAREEGLGMDRLASYQALAQRVQRSRHALVTTLRELKAHGRRIAAYGAPAKGNTLLNYAGIGPDVLDYAVDDLPTKQGRFTPGMRIPCHPRAHAQDDPPDHFLLLAWNYEQAVRERERSFLEAGGRFIIPIGDVIRVG